MLTESEANDLILEFISLRDIKDKTAQQKRQFDKQYKLCLEKFAYIIYMRTSKYKSFINYEDLNQDGMEALMKAMSNYEPKKGSFFWWAHKYVGTRIARRANLHSTIRYPLKYAKENMPYKQQLSKEFVQEKSSLDLAEEYEVLNKAISLVSKFSEEHQKIFDMYYGFKQYEPMTITKICEHLSADRSYVLGHLTEVRTKIKEKLNTNYFK